MNRLITVKVSFLILFLAISSVFNTVNAQELRQLTQVEMSSLLDRIFQQGNLCPEGFTPNGAYPKSARCISFTGYGNCPSVAKGCVEQSVALQQPARLLFPNTPKEVPYCNCPASFSNWGSVKPN